MIVLCKVNGLQIDQFLSCNPCFALPFVKRGHIISDILIQVECGHPKGLSSFLAGAQSTSSWFAAAFQSILATCPNGEWCHNLTRVHIIAQQGNQYILAFYIAILYIFTYHEDTVKRPEGGALVYTEVRSAHASTCRRRSTVFLESADWRV